MTDDNTTSNEPLDIVKMHGPKTDEIEQEQTYDVVNEGDEQERVGSEVAMDRPLDKAEAAGLPPDRGPEVDVINVRPAMFRAHPFIFSAMALVGLLGLMLLFWKGLFPYSLAWLVVSLVLFLGACGMWGVWKIKTLGTSLRITNKRTVVIIGLFSRATSEVVHDNIRNIQVTQSFLQRVFRVGRIGLSSSGQDGIEIDVPNLPNPDQIREIIDKYRPL